MRPRQRHRFLDPGRSCLGHDEHATWAGREDRLNLSKGVLFVYVMNIERGNISIHLLHQKRAISTM